MLYGLVFALTASLVVVNAVVVPEPLIRGKKNRQLLSDKCEFDCCSPDVVVDLNFDNAEIVVNNLGGEGPGNGIMSEEVIRIKDVGTHESKTIDLEISVKTTYEANNSDRNGLRDGEKVGQINLKTATNTTLTFTFYEGGNKTKPMVLPAFKFSIFDIDMGSATREIYEVEGFTHALYDCDSDEIIFDKTCSGSGCVLKATSDAKGKGCDNPFDPMDLKTITCKGNTVDQFARSFQVEFKNTSTFDLYFEADHKKNKTTSGRNFVWAFDSAWSRYCPSVEPECSE